jgi:hypothetical protein
MRTGKLSERYLGEAECEETGVKDVSGQMYGGYL